MILLLCSRHLQGGVPHETLFHLLRLITRLVTDNILYIIMILYRYYKFPLGTYYLPIYAI